MRLAIDVMGGDIGPPAILPAVIRAAEYYSQCRFLLFGDERQIRGFWPNSQPVSAQFKIIHCSQQVAMDERPSRALRQKTDSSMYQAIAAVEQGHADACVSAGNTGALLAMAATQLKLLPGVDRPALVSAMPNSSGKKVLLLDLGANVNCDSETLFQYAAMGAVMAEEVEGVQQPRIALLNVGEEPIKGNDRVKQAAQLLRDSSLNFIGFIEGSDIFSDTADVVVTDGFTGNIALKSCEGLAQLVLHEVKQISQASLINQVMGRIALPILKRIVQRVNPDQYNGASLLGLRGVVVKSHGNASAEAFYYALEEAIREATRQVPDKIKHKLSTLFSQRL